MSADAIRRADALILKIDGLRDKRLRALEEGNFRRSEEAAAELKVATAELNGRLEALSAHQQSTEANALGTTP